jgi:predicted DNA-binding antitoxin AbrB/MazE fold protein
MIKTIRARFIKGIIEPLEKIDLDEGKEITVTIRAVSIPAKPKDAIGVTAGGWKGLIDGEKLKRNIYSDRLIKTRREIEHADFLSD